MGSTIYVIEGQSGDRSGGSSWLVQAFRTKSLAENYVNDLNYSANLFMQQAFIWRELVYKFQDEVCFQFEYGSAERKLADEQLSLLLDYEPLVDDFQPWNGDSLEKYLKPSAYDDYYYYSIKKVYLDECPEDGMYTPNSWLCPSCNGGV